MFKLIKIQNSGVNVPEPIIIKKLSETEIKSGEALTLEYGYLTSCIPTQKPLYVAINNAKYDDEYAVVFEVNSNMLFETTINGDPSELFVGDKVTMANDENGSAVMVSSNTTSGVATIVDLMDAEKIGDKITVKF